MMSFKINSHTMWMQHGLQGIGDLLADPLLHGEALRKEPHQAGQLGNTDDVFVCNIAYIRPAMERKGMVFTQCKERDGTLHYLA